MADRSQKWNPVQYIDLTTETKQKIKNAYMMTSFELDILEINREFLKSIHQQCSVNLITGVKFSPFKCLNKVWAKELWHLGRQDLQMFEKRELQ